MEVVPRLIANIHVLDYAVMIAHDLRGQYSFDDGHTNDLDPKFISIIDEALERLIFSKTPVTTIDNVPRRVVYIEREACVKDVEFHRYLHEISIAFFDVTKPNLNKVIEAILDVLGSYKRSIESIPKTPECKFVKYVLTEFPHNFVKCSWLDKLPGNNGTAACAGDNVPVRKHTNKDGILKRLVEERLLIYAAHIVDYSQQPHAYYRLLPCIDETGQTEFCDALSKYDISLNDVIACHHKSSIPSTNKPTMDMFRFYQGKMEYKNECQKYFPEHEFIEDLYPCVTEMKSVQQHQLPSQTSCQPLVVATVEGSWQVDDRLNSISRFSVSEEFQFDSDHHSRSRLYKFRLNSDIKFVDQVLAVLRLMVTESVFDDVVQKLIEFRKSQDIEDEIEIPLNYESIPSTIAQSADEELEKIRQLTVASKETGDTDQPRSADSGPRFAHFNLWDDIPMNLPVQNGRNSSRMSVDDKPQTRKQNKQVEEKSILNVVTNDVISALKRPNGAKDTKAKSLLLIVCFVLVLQTPPAAKGCSGNHCQK
ncbi:unnamed protein product [Didymodactylos carnosus]|uniref:Uncharacterized protein n=1 Tax=Didymodactylos carnosus TaxID=1234261 RepID=A0A814YA98_9BILA|nr:unnamed protein product [Didymodactylos carnosus]CAF3989970.1 unnamed protein product [Didymodactylos carnosus]